jgi:hypothetical protein
VIDFPALPGWADVWQSALRAFHPWRFVPLTYKKIWGGLILAFFSFGLTGLVSDLTLRAVSLGAA